MPDFISLNHKIQPTKNACVSAVSAAALYGRGVFTTIAIHNSIPFLWEKHWRRLHDNARKISIKLNGFSEVAIYQDLLAIIEKNNVTQGRTRLTFYDETPSRIWQNISENKTNFLIQTAELRSLPDVFRLSVSPFRINSTSPLAGVKSCNYLENILALEDAKARSSDEAIRLNELDEVVSACMANVFWTKNGKIFTPSLETGCLSGTTREFFMEKFKVKETRATLKELRKADEIFLTSAGIGVIKSVLCER